tara:strand:+ start:523 stop:780 length:258 start_codon:yes stop_codon:yes gene_type:complete
MAFSRDGLSRVGGSGNSRAVWLYASTDAPATVTGSNYMIDAIDEISLGDVVLVVDTDGVVVTVTFCKSNNGTAIDLASGTQLGDS